MLYLYLWMVLLSAAVAFVVNFLAAQDEDFSWDPSTCNVVLGSVFGVDFLAATGAATAVLDLLFVILLQRLWWTS